MLQPRCVVAALSQRREVAAIGTTWRLSLSRHCPIAEARSGLCRAVLLPPSLPFPFASLPSSLAAAEPCPKTVREWKITQKAIN